MQSRAPLLVIVSGAPASGKTTLATRFAADLGLLLIGKDALKEAISEAIGVPGDVAASSRLGSAAYSALFTLARETLAAGEGVVIESNFRRRTSEAEFRPLLRLGDARLIHCRARADVMAFRYRDRGSQGRRHAAHRDDERSSDVTADLESGAYEPPDLSVPTMVVSTDDGLVPAYGEIVAFAARATTR